VERNEPSVQVSSRHPTELACLEELLKWLQDRHVECAEAVAKKAAADAASAADVSPDTPNVLQAIMQLEQAKTRAKAANKLALEAEKEKDDAEKEVEELKRLLKPKRELPHDDVGDAHEMLAEVDNWDLIVHLRETTRVQNRRNAQVGSRQNQPTPRTGTTTGTSSSSLNCGCIGLLMICQDSRFRSGTPQRVLTTQVLRWQCSSTRASCPSRTSTSRK
jgi:hypothetical protein